jgi:outer membrane protein, heavy metal efflux system
MNLKRNDRSNKMDNRNIHLEKYIWDQGNKPCISFPSHVSRVSDETGKSNGYKKLPDSDRRYISICMVVICALFFVPSISAQYTADSGQKEQKGVVFQAAPDESTEELSQIVSDDQHPVALRPFDRPADLHILESYFQMAVENNPELASIRKEAKARKQQATQVRAWPDPEISVGYYLNPVHDAQFINRFSAGVMQPIPWFGTLGARSQVEESVSASIRHMSDERQIEIFNEIQDLWFEYFKLNHHVHVNLEILQIVLNLESLVETRFETGRTGQSDILRLQMQEQRISNNIEKLIDEKNPLRERFNALLNRDPDETIEVPLQLPERSLEWTKEQLFAYAKDHHPGFNRLEASRSAYRSSKELARLEGRPSFGVGLEYMGRDFGMSNMFTGMNETFTAMASIRLPLNRGRYRAQKQEAELQIQAADHLEEDLANRLFSDLEKAMKTLRDGQREYRLISEELFPRTETIFELLMEEYRTGKARFDEILQVISELLDLENEKIEALAMQNMAMADIEQWIAIELKNFDARDYE